MDILLNIQLGAGQLDWIRETTNIKIVLKLQVGLGQNVDSF